MCYRSGLHADPKISEKGIEKKPFIYHSFTKSAVVDFVAVKAPRSHKDQQGSSRTR